MLKFIIIISLFMYSCSINGRLHDSENNKTMKVYDSRDGDVWYFNTNTVHDVRIGIGSSTSFKVVSIKGDTVAMDTNLEAFLNVKECRGNED